MSMYTTSATKMTKDSKMFKILSFIKENNGATKTHKYSLTEYGKTLLNNVKKRLRMSFFKDLFKAKREIDFSDLILEMLDSPTDYWSLKDWSEGQFLKHEEQFKVNGFIYGCESTYNSEADLFMFDFYKLVNNIKVYDITNDSPKQEVLIIFSTIRIVFEKYLKLYNPKMIFIASNHSKKFKLYRMIFQKYLNNYSYTNSGFYSITMLRNDYEQELKRSKSFDKLDPENIILDPENKKFFSKVINNKLNKRRDRIY